MSHRTPINLLAVLAAASVILDILGGVLSPEPRGDYTMLLFGGRLLLDVGIVAVLFLRHRFVWVALTALYSVAILWRGVILIPGLLGLTHLPSPVWASWLLASHLAIAIASILLLFRRRARDYFGFEPSV